MTDFFREVDEEYRRDRVLKLLQRYQVPLAVLVVLIVVGTGGYKFWVSRQLADAEKVNTRYMAAVDLAHGGKTQEALADFLGMSKDAPSGYAMLARMQTAGLIGTTNAESGAKAFDAIANDEKLVASLRDAARLRGAILRLDNEEPKAFETRYGRFAAAGFAYHNSMRELLAMAALKGGDYNGAKRYLDEIIIDAQAPEELRKRAQAFRELAEAGPAQPTETPPPAAAITPIGQKAPTTSAPTTPAAKTPASATPAPSTPAPKPPAAQPAPAPSAPKPSASPPPAPH